MEKQKQRAVYFTDKEWEEVKQATEKSPHRSIAQFVNVELMKVVKRKLK